MSGLKPFGRNDIGPGRVARDARYVGSCTECGRGVFSGQQWARVSRPTIGLNHDECVPEGATVVEVSPR